VSVSRTDPVLEVRGLRKYFDVARSRGGGRVHAVDDVDLTISPGEVLGLVGESGSGKSTVGKCIVRLLEPTAGTVRLHGRDVTHLSERQLRSLRRQVHMVFQDPYSSLNPRMQVGDIISEPLRMHRLMGGKEAERRVRDMLETVGLSAEMTSRYPHELSGGQRQRVGLARSLVLEPSLLIADEPVSALDVSVQASIINLLLDLQRDMGFSCLFIAHDLATVEFLCNRVAVMYLGRIVEIGDAETVARTPRHPYADALFSASLPAHPDDARDEVILAGEVPSPLNPPRGCAFHPRCPRVLARCGEELPSLRAHDGRALACHLYDQVEAPVAFSSARR